MSTLNFPGFPPVRAAGPDIPGIPLPPVAGPVCEAADWLANCGHGSCYLIQEDQEQWQHGEGYRIRDTASDNDQESTS